MRYIKRPAVLLATALVIPALAGSIPTATAAEPTAPLAVETFGYPDAAKVLSEQGVTLKTGDGNIRLADCTSSGDLLRVSSAVDPKETCFKVSGPSGYLALEIPRVYTIWSGGDRAVKATLSADGTVSSVDLVKNQWTEVGEGDSKNPKQSVLLELTAGGGTAAQAPAPEFPFVGSIAVGPAGRAGSRGCTATLVDPSWVLTSAGCFTDNPAALAAGAPATKSTANIAGKTVDIAELVPRTDRDLVMARLAIPTTGTAPAAIGAAPVLGEVLKVAGYGRTKTEWVPTAAHSGTATVTAVAATGITAQPTAGSTICMGDAGGPAWRTVNSKPALVALTSRSWQTDCLGSTATLTGASQTRVDDLAGWVQQVKASRPGSQLFAVGGDGTISVNDGSYGGSWGTFALVPGAGSIRQVTSVTVGTTTRLFAIGGDNKVYTATRPTGGAWSGFALLDSSGIQSIAATVSGNVVRLFAVGGGGTIWTTDSTNGGPFTPFDQVPGASGVKQVATTSIGDTIRLFAIGGDTQIWTADKKADGTWTAFNAITSNGIQSIAATTSGNLVRLFAAGSDGKIWTTDSTNGGPWTAFDVVPGTTAGGMKQVATTTIGDTIRLFAIGTDTKIRTADKKADGTWTAFTTLDSNDVRHIAATVAG
ncbi:trypsin-like serine protease [Kitasatospora herbaricolor]|uniref:S1 family peptidase n=1 Tax=Kitasatospora herbaricolor TaxID=68217 RepID=A0ABZ1WK00_9ACTN|nr:trypsin-like serine protease [Kitasatospora herbaricolor]